MGNYALADGREALRGVLRQAGFPTILHAVARHTVFLHPQTVRQTGGEALFRVIRGRDNTRRGRVVEHDDGRPVVLCDNTTPTDAFLWSARAKRTRATDVVFNHVWDRSKDVHCYTALWNVCVTPAFLSKLTDGDESVRRALRRRSFELYGYLPPGEPEPSPDPQLDAMEWAPHPPAVADLEQVLRERLARCRKSRAAVAARECG